MTNPKKNRKIFNIVLAIVLAVGVWMYVINVENPSGTGTVREIPVTVVGEDSLAERGLMVTEQNRDHVSLKLSGRKKTLMKLNRKRDSGSRRVHRDGGGQLPGRCGDHRS